jgi:hypothetical protein
MPGPRLAIRGSSSPSREPFHGQCERRLYSCVAAAKAFVWRRRRRMLHELRGRISGACMRCRRARTGRRREGGDASQGGTRACCGGYDRCQALLELVGTRYRRWESLRPSGEDRARGGLAPYVGCNLSALVSRCLKRPRQSMPDCRGIRSLMFRFVRACTVLNAAASGTATLLDAD